MFLMTQHDMDEVFTPQIQQAKIIKNGYKLALFLLLLSFLLFDFGNKANAAGYRIPENSAAGISLSNALVANNEEAGALAYNPAAMSFHDGVITAGLSYITFDLSVTPTGGSKVDNIGEDTFILPNFYIMDKFSDNLSLGFAINTPFGLETKWPDNTFPAFAGVNSLDTALTHLEVVNYSPNIAYRLDEYLSIAFGINYYDARSANLNTHGVTIEGKGQHHGYTVAFLQEMGDLDFGFAYRSAVTINIDGRFNSTPATATLNLPWYMQFGFRYKFNNQLAMEFDIERTGWSKFQDITVNSKATGAQLTKSLYQWENSNAYRLGLTYDLNADTQLRFGYALDETPVKGDAKFSARTPDSDRQEFSLGIAQNLSDWLIEASYMYVVADDRTENSGTTYTLGSDPNGSSAYNGQYEGEGHVIGLGVVKKF